MGAIISLRRRMHAHSRIATVLSQLDPESAANQRIDAFERNLLRMFAGSQQLYDQLCTDSRTGQLLVSACEGREEGEPHDRFVNLSRNLQTDSSMGYNNFKQASRSRTEARTRASSIPSRIKALEEQSPVEKLFDPKVMLGVASTGLALALLPSSSAVPRSALSRLWPQLLQFAIAYLVYVRKNQDRRSGVERPNTVLYVLTALIQAFTAIRDFQGHSLASLASRTLLGPIDPLFSIMKTVILGLPTFLFKTILLSGISLLGKIAIVTTIAASIVVALGLLIVAAA